MKTVANVLICGNPKAYLAKSLFDVMEKSDFRVTMFDLGTGINRKITEEIDAIVIYIDSTILANLGGLEYINRYAIENLLPVFLIGMPDEIATIGQKITDGRVAEKFVRPIDINEIIRKIEYYMTHQDEEKKTILAVDDSGMFLRQINSWFSDKYRVALVNSGMNAIRYLTSHRPDLILLDYQMPVCDGKQVLEMIRSDTECGNIPVIFLTANGDRECITEVMKLRVAGYLLKTLPPEEIIKYIDDFFAKNV